MESLPEHVGAGVYISSSSAQTQRLGEALGGLLEAGDVLILTGDLGAGKTQLTKGVAKGMGVPDDVTSPTFTIEMVYEGKELPLYHFDLYRLDSPDQLEDTGLFDVLGSDGPCLIEWGEQFSSELGDERADVTITRLDDEVEEGIEPPRRIAFMPQGTRAEALVKALDAAVAAAE